MAGKPVINMNVATIARPTRTPWDSGGAASARTDALDLIQAARDPRHGLVDTQQLASWVAQAQRHDAQAASRAHAAIEAELLRSDPADVHRFARDVVRNVQQDGGGPTGRTETLQLHPSGQWAAGQYLAKRGDGVLIDNPILNKRWEFAKSAWTGKGGPSESLKSLLESHGIDVLPESSAVPHGSLDPEQAKARGLSRQQANNVNGSVARDAIAARFQAQGFKDVETEVARLDGKRRVDVFAVKPGSDPRYATHVETESKVGRTAAGSVERAQVAKDAQQLADNRALRRGGTLLSRSGRIIRPLGVAIDAVNVTQAYRADGNRVGEHTGRAASGLAGGAAGAWGGAAAGAAIGSAVPVVGTLIGGVVGGIIGGVVGDAAGRGLFNGIRELF